MRPDPREVSGESPTVNWVYSALSATVGSAPTVPISVPVMDFNELKCSTTQIFFHQS